MTHSMDTSLLLSLGTPVLTSGLLSKVAIGTRMKVLHGFINVDFLSSKQISLGPKLSTAETSVDPPI